MMALLAVPFLLQGAAMFFDEIYFHRKRGLPIWERVGHPLDSLSVFLCYLFIYLQSPTPTHIYIYVGLCAFSCLLVTKDEFVHTEKCEARENWLHAFLFILHPITFLCAGLIWTQNKSELFLLAQPIIIFVFMMYQIVYWSPFGIKQRKS